MEPVVSPQTIRIRVHYLRRFCRRDWLGTSGDDHQVAALLQTSTSRKPTTADGVPGGDGRTSLKDVKHEQSVLGGGGSACFESFAATDAQLRGGNVLLGWWSRLRSLPL